MSVFSMATTVVTWKRSTAYVLDSVAVAASHTPDRQPTRASCVQVKLTGSPTGTVTITGTVEGVSDSEALTWTGSAGARVTMKQFTAITTITTSLSGGTLIDAQAVGTSGQPQASTYTLKAGHPVQLSEDHSPRWPGAMPGHERTNTSTCRVQYEETWAPRQGDVVVAGTGETWHVVGNPRVGGELGPDHWRVRLEQREGA